MFDLSSYLTLDTIIEANHHLLSFVPPPMNARFTPARTRSIPDEAGIELSFAIPNAITMDVTVSPMHPR